MQDISTVCHMLFSLRSSFGTTGVRFQEFLEVFRLSCGLDSSHGLEQELSTAASRSMGDSITSQLYLVSSHCCRVGLAIKGFHGIKWLENFSCVFIVAILAYMLYVVKTKFAVDISASFANVKGYMGHAFLGCDNFIPRNLLDNDHQRIRLFEKP